MDRAIPFGFCGNKGVPCRTSGVCDCAHACGASVVAVMIRTVMPHGRNDPYVQGTYVRTEPDGRITVMHEGKEVTGHPPCPITKERLIDMP